MVHTQAFHAALKIARKTKKAVGRYLAQERPCDCQNCFEHSVKRPLGTIETHRRRYGRHILSVSRPSATPDQPGIPPLPLPHLDDPTTSDEIMEDVRDEFHSFSIPTHPELALRAQSQSPAQSPFRSYSRSGSLSPASAFSLSRSASRSRSRSQSVSRSASDGIFQSPCSSATQPTISPAYRASSPSSSYESDEEDLDLVPGDPICDAIIFGRLLADDRAVAPPPPLRLRGGNEEMDMREEDGGGDGGSDDDDEHDGGDEPGGDENEARPGEAAIQVQPADEGQPNGPDDEDNQIMAFNEHPALRNIYLRTWVLYAFCHATQESIQAILQSHKLALLATAQAAHVPPELIAQIEKMPLTLRALERRIGMDFADSITIYPICPVEACGKRYTFEELEALQGPQCTRHVEEPRCPGLLYKETVLADGTRKRTPTKSFPYNSLIKALGRLTSRIGMPDFMQHWRGPDDEPLEADQVPPPLQAQDWINQVQLNDRFSDITQGWLWRAQATGLTRIYDGDEYIDEPTGDEALSLSRLPLGLSLGMNMDGFQAFRGKFTAGGSYSVNGVYIVINNLPFYLRTLIENMILTIVIPGPKEPKGYALDQMLEPLVDDLVRLANGVELPVYNHATGRVEQQLVHANLSTLFLDWIARIKCTGHVGTKAEHNHCLYCKIRQCLLSTEDGYRANQFEYRNPFEHLQLKHEWHRAPADEREEIRQANGTTFVELDRAPGFYSFDNCPIDVMHLFDEGLSPAIVRDIIYKPGMLRKRFRQQPQEETPEAMFDAFIARTYFPSHCSRLPTKISKMGSRMKAEQWRTLLVVLPAALFEAWRVGDAIPEGDIPRGGQNTKHRKQQTRNAKLLLQRRRHVHDMNGGDLDDAPEIEDCASSRNPRDYFANVMRYCVAYKGIFRHRITRLSVSEISTLLELVGVTFARMNIHLPPSFHLATHLGDHLLKYGNAFNTWLYYFERANRILININTNGHGMGVLEATMAKGFLRRAECYRYVKMLQDIQEPTDDDLATLNVLLDAMRHGPEHEAQHGMLNAVLAGEAHFHGLEHIRLATVSARVDFQSREHTPYYQLVIQFINNNNPFDNHVQFYGPGVRPPGGVWIAPRGSTVSYPNFYRHGVRYGADSHHRGKNSRYGYIYDRRPVLIKAIYETTLRVEGEEHKMVCVAVQRFVEPAIRPVFPWDRRADELGIHSWEFEQLGPIEIVPATAFTGVFALSDIELEHGHYWLSFAMINTEPEDLVPDYD